MSRLIDADALKKIIDEREKWILELIDEQPTAYDVEKVVAELKRQSRIMMPVITTEDAIDIVRKGGIE